MESTQQAPQQSPFPPPSRVFSPSGVQDMTWFSANFVYYTLSFLVFSEVSILLMKRLLPKHSHFSGLSLRIQRNMAVYILEVVVTIILFVLTVTSGMQLILGKGTSHDILVARTTLTILIALYLFELCYRPDMNWQLTLHHIFTIALSIVVVQGSMESMDKKLIAAGLVLSFTATTEQLCFISLFLYRLKHKYAGPLMKIAAVQSLSFKFAAVVGLYIIAIQAIWTDKNIDKFPAQGWFIALRVLLLTVVPGLVFTQIYGAYILWKISCRTKRPEPQADDIRKSIELEKANVCSLPPPSETYVFNSAPRHISHTLSSLIFPDPPSARSSSSLPTRVTRSKPSISFPPISRKPNLPKHLSFNVSTRRMRIKD